MCKELIIPSIAKKDPNSFELLRVWAANEEQHVSINQDLSGNAHDFGYMLAQLARHGANIYSERESKNFDQILKSILNGFNSEIHENAGKTKREEE